MLWRSFAPYIRAHRPFGDGWVKPMVMGVPQFPWKPYFGRRYWRRMLPPAWICRTVDGERGRAIRCRHHPSEEDHP